jgi:hypothetical protein
MKPSTLVELAGFAALSYMAWQLNTIAGWGVAGLFLLFIGYALEDDKAAIAVRRMVAPVGRLRVKRQLKREVRRDARRKRRALAT